MIDKSPPLQAVADPRLCRDLANGDQGALAYIVENAPPEAVTSGLVAASQIVCKAAFRDRFKEVLIGACINLAGCKF